MDSENGLNIKLFCIYFLLIIFISTYFIRVENFYVARVFNHLPDVSLLFFVIYYTRKSLKWRIYFLSIILCYFIIFELLIYFFPQIIFKDFQLYINFIFSVLFISFFINISKSYGTSLLGNSSKVDYKIWPISVLVFLGFVHFVESAQPDQEPFIILFSLVVTFFVLANYNVDQKQVDYKFILWGILFCAISFWIAIYKLIHIDFQFSYDLYRIFYYLGFFSLLLGYSKILKPN